jgi:hypothetical protein
MRAANRLACQVVWYGAGREPEMKMHKPWQFRLATLLALMTATALCVDFCRRHVELRAAAIRHAQASIRYRLAAAEVEQQLKQFPPPRRAKTCLHELEDVFPSSAPIRAAGKRSIRDLNELSDYHRALAHKYRVASRFPWQPLAPDPPPPK